MSKDDHFFAMGPWHFKQQTDLVFRRGKSDLILEGVLRVEKYLQEMNGNIVSVALLLD